MDTGGWITEVCSDLNNDWRSQTEQRTFLCVATLNMCPFCGGDRFPASDRLSLVVVAQN